MTDQTQAETEAEDAKKPKEGGGEENAAPEGGSEAVTDAAESDPGEGGGETTVAQ